jgi:predicted O-methyltransferase YrrM
METRLRQLLTALEEAGRHHDAQEPDHSRKMLNLEPETAHLLSMLVRSSRRTRLLEIGTSNGYSTIWLAWATRPMGGHVTSIEREAHKLSLADANLRQAGLREMVDLIHGDATQKDHRYEFHFFELPFVEGRPLLCDSSRGFLASSDRPGATSITTRLCGVY